MIGKNIARRIAKLQERLLPAQGPIMGYRLVEAITGRVLAEILYCRGQLVWSTGPLLQSVPSSHGND